MIDTVRAFSALSEEFVERSLEFDPVSATLAGIHDYDARYPLDTPDGFRDRSVWLRDLDDRLVASVPWEELPVEARSDFALLRSRLATLRAGIDEVRDWSKTPARYPDTALRGLFLLMARPFAPLDERKESAVARLMAVPDYLEAATRCMPGEVPELMLEVALEVNATGPGYVDDMVRQLVRSHPGEAERIEHAGARARMGFLRYQEFLEKDLAARVGGSFAIGERWMNYRLEREHLLSMDCAYLQNIGQAHLARLRGALETEARRLDPRRDWRTLVAEAKTRHPEPLRVRDAYVAEMERARRFVEERRIAPMTDCRLEIVDTPVFERAITPIATYLPPAPFDVEQTGYFFVTPVDLSRRGEELDEQLHGHNHASITLVSLHEAYPGHHLHLAHASKNGSRLRRLVGSDLLAEGWALYCEELMYEQGFFEEPFARLIQLRNELWRACRVLIDVGIQTGRMGFPDAVKLLVEEVMLERESAEKEVKHYAANPTRPLSYLVGKELIMELREETRGRLGERFSLYDFHAAVLKSGSLPPFLLRAEVNERLGIAG